MSQPDEVRCAACGRNLPQQHGDAAEERSPCPDCGSTARKFIKNLRGQATTSSTTHGSLTVISADDLLPALSESASARIEETIETLSPIVRTIEMLEPTDDEGSWTVSVYDDNDGLIAMSEQQSLDDALLAVLEQLKPQLEDDN